MFSSLGLTIANSLVRMMNGEVTVTSEIGIGSTFAFVAEFGMPELPDCLPEECGQENKSGQDSSRQSGKLKDGGGEDVKFDRFRVLVAEDNKVNQFVASKILRSVGATFKLVEDGVQAVKAFEEDDFYDIILMVGVVAVGVRDSCMLDLFWKLVVSNMPMHCSTWHVPL